MRAVPTQDFASPDDDDAIDEVLKSVEENLRFPGERERERRGWEGRKIPATGID